MYQRNSWSQKEDQVLIKVILETNVKKWSEIAKIMEKQFQVVGRTGKQCRQRWYNTLNPTVNVENWNLKDSKKLFEYHAIYGNKWAKIATLFGNRSDNSVKNHFYSTLRKSHRIINKYIKRYRKKFPFRPFKNNVLLKIISLTDPSITEASLQLVQKSKQILGLLIEIGQSQDKQFDLSFIEKVVQHLLNINKNYKKKKCNRRKYKSSPTFDLSSSDDNFSISQQEIKRLRQTSVGDQHLEQKPSTLFFNSTTPCFQIPKILNSNVAYFQTPIIQPSTTYYLLQNSYIPLMSTPQICYQPQYIQTQPTTIFYPQFWSNMGQ